MAPPSLDVRYLVAARKAPFGGRIQAPLDRQDSTNKFCYPPRSTSPCRPQRAQVKPQLSLTQTRSVGRRRCHSADIWRATIQTR